MELLPNFNMRQFSRHLAASALLLNSIAAQAQSDFIAFESGPVRPVAILPDQQTVAVTNISDNRIELFDVSNDQLVHYASLVVGLEPVAIAVLDENTLFVANHLSDSVSVVKLTPTPHIERTLLVGDEPRDLVLADPDAEGPLSPRLFVTTARRGQHRDHPSLVNVDGAGDARLTEASIPRADVWVFDTADLGDAVGGIPLKIVELFSDTPRALAVSPDERFVYAAAFFSGNQTTTINNGLVCDGFEFATPCTVADGISTTGGLADGQVPGGNPGPSANSQGIQAPEVGLIVKWNPDAGTSDNDVETGEFQDELGRNWNNAVRFRLPDKDVFAIDSSSLNQAAEHRTVGTTLFNMAVNPISGELYVSNTEANNLQRFEGPGELFGSTVQGHLAKSRITVIPDPNSSSSAVSPRHLNKHIDYTQLPAPRADFEKSVSTPLEMAVSPDGSELFLTAMGSNAIAYFDTQELADNSYTPDANAIIRVSGGGPGGLALNNDGSRLYVYTRYDNGLSIIDANAKSELAHQTFFTPEPRSVIDGRPFLYDATLTSSNGEAACASCHIFGDTDHLAWDLGNPDEHVKDDPIPTLLGMFAGNSNGGAGNEEFHPMKGPMTTQTLRGLENSGAMHWRGDRANGVFGMHPTDADLSFRNFIEAFPGLVGKAEDLADHDMQAFTDFQLQVMLPPNPVRQLDNSLRANEQRAADFYSGPRLSDGVTLNTSSPNLLQRTGFTCNGCHELDPSQGFFGTGTNQSFEGSTQILKVPHLRNMYTKVGMFGVPRLPGITTTDNSFMGDQIRGFGFIHDGSVDTLFRFFNLSLFQSTGLDPSVGFTSSAQQVEMEQFMLSFNTDLAPIVGQQVSLNAELSQTALQDVNERIELLKNRSQTSFVSKSLGGNVLEADLVAVGMVDGINRSWLYQGNELFLSDLNERYGTAELSCLVYTDGPLTFTAVPPGSGSRIALDRDRDGVQDGLDNDRSNAIRQSVTVSGVDQNSEEFINCLAMKEARQENSARYDCDNQQLTFSVKAPDETQYRASMTFLNESSPRFSLDAVTESATAFDNVASYSPEEGLLLPVVEVSCANVLGNLRMNLVSEAPTVFEVVGFD